MTEMTEAEVEAAKAAGWEIRGGAPDGWTLVPTALTPEMRAAATGWHGLDEMWRKTLAAAPQPPLLPIYGATEDPAGKPALTRAQVETTKQLTQDVERLTAENEHLMRLVRGALVEITAGTEAPPLMPILGATEEPTEVCKHPRMNRCGTGSSSGWSRVTWNCPDCGTQGEHITPARELTEDQGPDVLGIRKGEEL